MKKAPHITQKTLLKTGQWIQKMTDHLVVWLCFDVLFIGLFLQFLDPQAIPYTNFIIAHVTGIVIAAIVMFTGLGAGVLWVPILTFLHVNPSEAVSLSVFTQIAGKGIGSYNYLRAGLVDLKVARAFIPFAFIGVLLGFATGFFISQKYERILLYMFILVALYLLIKMIQSLNDNDSDDYASPTYSLLKKSRMVVIVSSFFTGLLSIGNSDWLIPYMENKLALKTNRAIATGLFIMFCCSVFFLALYMSAVCTGWLTWPASSPILYATCSGVIAGGQIGTRLVGINWLKNKQKHAFILMLSLSIIHLLW